MANQTISGTNTNYDDSSISGLLNGEDITLNGGSLTIDSDMRWAQQNAVLGNVTISATLGGLFHMDARNVWELPFDASTGNVPTLGTLGTNTVTGSISGSGELLRVWASGELEPRASGGAMPTSGWIKLRSKTGNFADNEVVTLPGGATITVNSSTGGKRSWLHFVAEYQGLVTVPRLGEWRITGDWYELGVTDGTDDQVIPLPVADVCDGVWIETSPGSGIYEQWEAAGLRWGTATQFIPTDERGKFFGQCFNRGSASTTSGSAVISVSDTSGFAVGAPVVMSAGFANSDQLYIVSINPGVSITVNQTSNATGTGRTITGYEASITLARRSSNSCGFKPASGCKIRIPNAIVSLSISGFAGNISRGTIADRWEPLTTSAGVIKWDHVWGPGLYLNASAAYDVIVEDSSLGNSLSISNTANNTTLRNVIVGLESTREATVITLSSLFTNATLHDIAATRYASSGATQQPVSISDCANVSISGSSMGIFGSTTAITRGNADARTLSLTRCFNVSISNLKSLGGRIRLSQVSGCTISNTQYADQINGTTVNTNPLVGAFEVVDTSSNIFIDGFSNFAGISNVHPYTAILLTGGSSSDIEFRNLGTASSPYNMGSTNACGLIVQATVTLDLTLRRLYADNTRTTALSLANTVQNVTIDNVWGDGADTQAIAALAVTARGCRWTNSTTGQAAVYGRHWEDAFTTPTSGRFLIACNEPLASTASQVSATLGVGAGFTSTGEVSMPNLTDEVVWEMPYYALGYTGMANVAPTITGTNTGNFTLDFQYDVGSGWNGSWLTLNGTNLSGIGAIDPNEGVKFKVRADVNTANATNALRYIRFDGVTNSTDQRIQYPLPVTQNIGTIEGFANNTRIIVYNETTDTVVYDDIAASSPLTFNYDEGTDFTDGDVLRIYHVWVAADGSSATKKARTTTQAGPNGWNALLEQETCTTYAAYYSTYSVTGEDVYSTGEFARDGVNLQIDIDDPDNNWFAHRMFMWDKYDLWFNSGRRAFFLEISASDAANLSIGTLLLDNLSANTAKQADNINVVNSTSTLPVVNPTTGGGGLTMYSGGKILTTTTGGISPSEAQIKAWVRAELATEMARIDVAVSTRATSAGGGATPAQIWEYPDAVKVVKNTGLIPAAL
jgi:hypothetical protein